MSWSFKGKRLLGLPGTQGFSTTTLRAGGAIVADTAACAEGAAAHRGRRRNAGDSSGFEAPAQQRPSGPPQTHGGALDGEPDIVLARAACVRATLRLLVRRARDAGELVSRYREGRVEIGTNTVPGQRDWWHAVGIPAENITVHYGTQRRRLLAGGSPTTMTEAALISRSPGAGPVVARHLQHDFYRPAATTA
jgi:hypothetical protein